jgi:hypothetical protein
MCGRPLKSLLPLQRPAVQATIDLSEESIESRGSHALALVIRSMSGKLHCDRAVAFGSSMPTGNRQFRLRLFRYVLVLSYLLSPVSRSGPSCLKRGHGGAFPGQSFPNDFWEALALQWSAHGLLQMTNQPFGKLQSLKEYHTAWSLTNFKQTSRLLPN